MNIRSPSDRLFLKRYKRIQREQNLQLFSWGGVICPERIIQLLTSLVLNLNAMFGVDRFQEWNLGRVKNNISAAVDPFLCTVC